MYTFMLSKIVKVYCKREEGMKIGGGKRKRGKRNGIEVGWENRAEGGGGKGGGRRGGNHLCLSRGTNLPLSPSGVLVAELIVKLTEDRLTGEKETNFNLCSHMSHRNRT